MRSVDIRSSMTAIAAFAAPVLLVQAMGFIMGGGPAAVSAAPAETPSSPAPPKVVRRQSEPVTEAERRAGAYAQELSHAPCGESPFFHPSPTKPPVIEPTMPTLAPLPAVQLQGIMSGSQPVAIIGGRMYRVGDVFEGEWRITAIDASKRSVTLGESGQRSFTVTAE